MLKKLYDKTLPKRCEYCLNANPIGDDGEMVCRKRGITNANDNCHSYKYDPLKREPRRQKLDTNYSVEDFSL